MAVVIPMYREIYCISFNHKKSTAFVLINIVCIFKQRKVFSQTHVGCNFEESKKFGDVILKKMEEKKTSFIDLTYDQPIFDCVFSVGCFTEDKFLASGTAVVIAPNLAITAKHVVEDFIKKFQNIDLTQINRNEGNTKIEILNTNLIALQYQDNGHSLNIWRTQEVYFCLHTDIAFLFLLPFNKESENFKWETCNIDLVPPKVGSKIVGFGFHSSSIQKEINEFGEITLRWKDQPATTIGEVIEYHPVKRDESRINFPCLQTNAKFDGGMSGGPVFNETGHLCGLICSSLEPSNKDEEYVSYIALIWPCLITQLNIPYKELINTMPYPALHLAQFGSINALGIERITIEKKNDDVWYSSIKFNCV